MEDSPLRHLSFAVGGGCQGRFRFLLERTYDGSSRRFAAETNAARNRGHAGGCIFRPYGLALLLVTLLYRSTFVLI
jgi:hypothetical protein